MQFQPGRKTASLLFALAALLLAAFSAGSASAGYPDRIIKIVVPFAPGGGNDKAARYLNKIWTENKMLESVVTNKVGGGGSLAGFARPGASVALAAAWESVESPTAAR